MVSHATEFWIGGFSLNVLNISLDSLLVCMVSEKVDVNLIFTSL